MLLWKLAGRGALKEDIAAIFHFILLNLSLSLKKKNLPLLSFKGK